jgi:hypothetical protein
MSRRTGVADLPLHSGRAPAWLFARMTRLAREIAVHVVADQGPAALLRRLSDPFWFQAFGCVLGFDWHSSGVTTTVTGALKEGIRGLEHELGVFVQGGKGAASRKTPAEIVSRCDRLSLDAQPLVYASRMAAKVDSAAVQDGYELYHHAFIFTAASDWCVVQQGMNGQSGTARRYHWLSQSVASFVDEPHAAICCDRHGETLNLVAAEHGAIRQSSVGLATERPGRVLEVVRRYSRPKSAAARLPFEGPEEDRPVVTTPAFEAIDQRSAPGLLSMPARHTLELEDIDPRRLQTVLLSTYDRAPADFESLLGLEGVGARTLRALALVSEVIYGTPASTRDPARFAFAHGGKDGIPFPVDRETYERTIDTLHLAMARAHVDRSERVDALKRLSRFARAAGPPTEFPGSSASPRPRRSWTG